MPSKTKRQARFMAACAHGSKYPKCPKGDVAQKFNKADEGGALLSEAVKDINRTPRGDKFAKGLRRR